MSNVWLRQLFWNDVEVVDVYVSKKKQINKKGCFGFVCFTRKKDIENAARRNNGLML